MSDPFTTKEKIKAVFLMLMYFLMVPAMLFIAAGTLRWTMAWVYAGFFMAATIGSRLIALKRSPEMLKERAKFVGGEGVPLWDKVLVGIVGFYGPMVMNIVAGLDHRFGWTGEFGDTWVIGAAVTFAAGYAISVWATLTNQFFSSVVRIQEDRGHHVIKEGPYKYVRHPGYAGGLLAIITYPIMISSWWVAIPSAVYLIVLVVRTAMEDRLLIDDLEGYAAFTKETRYRLVPGIW